jgi:hypothetical protein
LLSRRDRASCWRWRPGAPRDANKSQAGAQEHQRLVISHVP